MFRQQTKNNLYLDSQEDLKLNHDFDLEIKAMCDESLRAFVYWAWKIIERGNPFLRSFFTDAVCDHLQAVYTRDITRLLILLPPRTSKSTLVSRIFPAWMWAQDATEEVLSVSNVESLAIELADKTKNIIVSAWFQRLWGWKPEYGDPNLYQGNYVSLDPANKAKTMFATTLGGKRRPLGVNSITTGKGGDTIVCDDLHDASAGHVESPLVREAVVKKFSQVISTRLNHDHGPRKSRMILVQQRVHSADVVGHVLKESPEDWTVLKLPLEFNPKKRCFTSLGFADPRTTKGESLDERRWPPEVIAKKRKELGPLAAAAQLDQEPTVASGNIIKLSDFKRYKELPSIDKIIGAFQSWDTASKSIKATYSSWAGTTWFITEEGLYLAHLFSERMDYPAGKEQIKYLYRHHFPGIYFDALVIEDRASGIALIQEFRQTDEEMRGVNIVDVYPLIDKEMRMRVENAQIRVRNIWIPADADVADWLPEFENAIIHFPGDIGADIIDSTSQGLAYYKNNQSSGLRISRAG